MSKYYTTLQTINNMFVGTVYEANTNKEVYKTQPLETQIEAVRSIDSFLATGTVPPNSATLPTSQTVITNTYIPSPTPAPSTRRCCGR